MTARVLVSLDLILRIGLLLEERMAFVLGSIIRVNLIFRGKWYVHPVTGPEL